jgi:deazaflavin-dependent oxidoreductase (nitroreductase family)
LRASQASRTRKDQFLYLTTKGWKTGAPHRIEIWFVKHQGRYFLVSQYGENAHWVQNIKTDPKVSFEVLNRKFLGLGRVVDSDLETDLAREVSLLMDSKYKWSDGLIVELRPEPGSE